MIRLFVAIDLPESVKDHLAPLCCGLPGARWVPGEQLHLTVRFIGEVDGGVFRDIRQGLEGVECDSFQLTLKGLGCFPPRKAPRVLWVGMEKSEELGVLRRRVDSCLKSCGISPEKRKFSPHITLARLKKTPLPRMVSFLENNGHFQLPAFQVSSFYLYSSALTSKGAIHTIEAIYPLGSEE